MELIMMRGNAALVFLLVLLNLSYCIGMLGDKYFITKPKDTVALIDHPTYLNCSTSDQYTISWTYQSEKMRLRRDYIYLGKRRRRHPFVGISANEHIIIFHDKTLLLKQFFAVFVENSTVDLIIPSVKRDFFGKYTCFIKEKSSMKMVAYASVNLKILTEHHTCQSGVVVGPNSCGIEPDEDVDLTCSVKYLNCENNDGFHVFLEWQRVGENSTIEAKVSISRRNIFEDIYTATIRIRNVENVSNYSYICQTTTSATIQYGCTIKPDVLYALKDETIMKEKAVVEIDDVVNCSVVSNVHCDFQWFYESRYHIVSTDRTLRPDRPGSYECWADCNLKRDNNNCTFKAMTIDASFHVDRSKVVMRKPNDAVVLVNKSIYFNCSTSDEYSIEWWFYSLNVNHLIYNGNLSLDGNRFKVYENNSNGTVTVDLIIPSVEPSDVGIYYCEIVEKNFKNTIIASNAWSLIVLAGKPVCESNVPVGPNSCHDQVKPENLHLSCRVSYYGNLPPILEWGKVGENSTIETDGEQRQVTCESYNGTVTSELTMKSHQDLDGSTYVCQTATSTILTKYDCYTNVTVLYALRKESTSSLKYVDINDLANCSVSSNVRCDYQWLYESQSKNNEYDFVSFDRTVNLNKMGFYRCVAYCNLMKDSFCSFTAGIFYTISSSSVKKFTAEQKHTKAFIGQVVYLNCSTSNQFIIEWQYQNKYSPGQVEIIYDGKLGLHDDKKYKVYNDSSPGRVTVDLIILSVQPKNAGQYSCIIKDRKSGKIVEYEDNILTVLGEESDEEIISKNESKSTTSMAITILVVLVVVLTVATSIVVGVGCWKWKRYKKQIEAMSPRQIQDGGRAVEEERRMSGEYDVIEDVIEGGYDTIDDMEAENNDNRSNFHPTAGYSGLVTSKEPLKSSVYKTMDIYEEPTDDTYDDNASPVKESTQFTPRPSTVDIEHHHGVIYEVATNASEEKDSTDYLQLLCENDAIEETEEENSADYLELLSGNDIIETEDEEDFAGYLELLGENDFIKKTSYKNQSPNGGRQENGRNHHKGRVFPPEVAPSDDLQPLNDVLKMENNKAHLLSKSTGDLVSKRRSDIFTASAALKDGADSLHPQFKSDLDKLKIFYLFQHQSEENRQLIRQIIEKDSRIRFLEERLRALEDRLRISDAASAAAACGAAGEPRYHHHVPIVKDIA